MTLVETRTSSSKGRTTHSILTCRECGGRLTAPTEGRVPAFCRKHETPRWRRSRPARQRPAWWILDRKTAGPQHGAALTFDEACLRLRALLAHRTPHDPWVERIGIFQGRRATQERCDKQLVGWELRARLAALHIAPARLATLSGVDKATVHYAVHGRGVSGPAMARLRAALTRLERLRGLRQDTPPDLDEDDA